MADIPLLDSVSCCVHICTSVPPPPLKTTPLPAKKGRPHPPPLANSLSLVLSWLDQWSFLLPAKIREIWRPRLKAWLKSNLVWNSDTNGNHARMATGVKIRIPIKYSYPLPRAFTGPHNPIPFTNGLHACAICAPTHDDKASIKRFKCLNHCDRLCFLLHSLRKSLKSNHGTIREYLQESPASWDEGKKTSKDVAYCQIEKDE